MESVTTDQLYLSFLPNELIQEISMYLDHISIVKLRKLTNSNINFQTLLLLKYPGFYKIFKKVREQSDDYRGFSYEIGYSLVDQLDRFLQQGIINSDKMGNEIDLRYTNIYSDDIEYLKNVIYENYTHGELRYIFTSYDLLSPGGKLPQYRLYKYRIEFPDTQIVKDEFVWWCDEYYYDTLVLTTLDERKKFLTDRPLEYLEASGETNLLLAEYFLMFLEHPETVELYREEPLKFILRDPPDNTTQQFHDYLILFNRIQQYIRDKLKK